MLGYLNQRYYKRSHFHLSINSIKSKNLRSSGLTLKQAAAKKKMNLHLKYTTDMLCKARDTMNTIWILIDSSNCGISLQWTWLLPSTKGNNVSLAAFRPQKFWLISSLGFLWVPPLTLCVEKYFSRRLWDFLPSFFNKKCLTEINE